jgi:hypothetical protein
VAISVDNLRMLLTTMPTMAMRRSFELKKNARIFFSKNQCYLASLSLTHSVSLSPAAAAAAAEAEAAVTHHNHTSQPHIATTHHNHTSNNSKTHTSNSSSGYQVLKGACLKPGSGVLPTSCTTPSAMLQAPL